MDMLDWTKLNPTVNKSETKKLFFSLYLFKAVVYAAGGRAIKSQASIDDYIDHRLAVCNNNRIGRYSRHLLENANRDQLRLYRNLIYSDKSISMRIEEPKIHIY